MAVPLLKQTTPPTLPEATGVQELLDQFTSLGSHVETLIFQQQNGLFWNSPPPDLSGWLKSLYVRTSTFRATWTLFLISVVQLIFVWAVLRLATNQIDTNGAIGSSSPSLLARYAVYVWLFITLALLPGLAALRWVIFLFLDKRYGFWRVRLPLFASVFGIAVGFIPWWFSLQIAPVRIALFDWAIIGIWLIFPPLTFMLALFLLLAVSFKTSLVNVLNFHRPVHRRTIERLLLEPIPNHKKAMDDSQSRANEWWLIGLDDRMFKLFQEWAKVNRENTEKRLIPTGVFFAVMGVFMDVLAGAGLFSPLVGLFGDWFQTFAGPLSRFTSLPGQSGPVSIPLDFLALTLVTTVVFVLAVIFAYMLWILFTNLAVQGLILEVCLLATYYRAEVQSHSVVPEQNQARARRGCLYWLR